MQGKPVILVVDDQPLNIVLLEAHLVPQGYEIVKAANGEEALRKLSCNQIDLILLDVMMPGMDGFEVTRRIRQDNTHRLLPIILLTSLRETEDRVKGYEAGCDDFISQPFDKMELYARVRSLLKVKAYNDLMSNYRQELESELTRKTKELKHAFERYFDLYDLAPVGYFTLSAAGLIMEANLTAATLLGLARSALVKQPLTRFILPADQDIYYRHRQLLFETGVPQVCEISMMHADAIPFWVRIDTVAGQGADGAPVCRTTMSDITEHKKMDELRDFLVKCSGPAQAEGFFALLAQYLAEKLGMDFIRIDRLEGDGLTARPVAVWCDGKVGDNVSYALKDTPCGEAVGKMVCCFPAGVCQFFPRDQALQDLRAESYVGVTLWSHTGHPIGLIAVVGRRPLVNRLLAEAILQLVAVRTASEMEWLDAEDDLKEALEKYRSLVTYVDSMYLVDRGGTYLFMNEGHLKRFGLPLEEIVGKRYGDFHSEEETRRFAEYVGKVCETGQPTTEEHKSARDGKIFLRTFTPVTGPSAAGKISQVAIISKDITNIKLAEKKLQDTLDSLRKAVNTTIQVMVSAVETRDPYTAGHQLRSANLACAIAVEMGLPPEKVEGVRMAGSIHDIGKLSIPAEILSKPTRLSELEFSLIKEHAHRGFEMLKDVESPWPLAEIVYQHHERMDGSGYPRNLQGEAMLMEARILAVSDVVESMASHRPYRPSLGIDAALEEIEKNSGTLYDKTVVAAGLRLFREKGYKL